MVLGDRILKVAEEMGKTVKTFKVFPACGTFGAIDKAREAATAEGYEIGSMCRDEPIALAKGVSYIAKWKNIERSDWGRIEGILLSNDMREGAVAMVIFE
jgi:hypothetical protein